MVEDISKGDYGVFYSKTLGEFFDVSVRENRVVLASPFTCRTEKSFSVSEFMSVIIGVNEFTAVSKDVENIMYEAAYDMFKDNLDDINYDLVNVKTEKKRIENHIEQLQDEVEKYNNYVIQASEKEEIELFEEALKQKNNKLEQIEELNKEISEISTKEKKY